MGTINDTYTGRVAAANLPDRDWLTRRYIDDGATIASIADEAGLSTAAVYAALHHHDIGLRGRPDNSTWGHVLTADLLADRLGAGLSLRAIARDVGCHPSTVREWATVHGLWTTEADTVLNRIKSAYEDGATIADVADTEGWGHRTARRKLLEAGVELRPPGRRAQQT